MNDTALTRIPDNVLATPRALATYVQDNDLRLSLADVDAERARRGIAPPDRKFIRNRKTPATKEN